ncbi:MAG TPA: YhgE/Pip domain-containing protein, partial [Peptococcaceae bacterium]|nr:YhgE/Pip domain-containing protein [Peptococcaceae bacterium]
SAKNALVQEIKSSFIATVNQTVFSMLNPVGEDADANLQNILKMKDALVKLYQNMDLINTSLDNLHTNSVNLNQFLISIKATWPLVQNHLDILGKTTVNQQELSRATQQRLDQSLNYLDTNLTYAQNSGDRIHALLNELNEAAKEGSAIKINSLFLNLDATLSAMSSAVDATAIYLDEYGAIDWGADVQYAKEQLISLEESLNTLYGELGDLREALAKMDTNQLYTNISTTVKTLGTVYNALGGTIDALNVIYNSMPSNNLKSIIDSLTSLRDATKGLMDTLQFLLGNWDEVVEAIQAIDQTAANAMKLIDETRPKIEETIKFLDAVQNSMSDKKQELSQMITALNAVSIEIDSMRTKLSNLQQQTDTAVQISAGIADTINNDLYQTERQLTSILKEYHQSIRGDISTIGSRLVTSADNTAKLVQSAQRLGSEIGNMLTTTQSGVALTADLTRNLSSKLADFESTINTLGQRLTLVDNDDIVQIVSILQSDPEFIGDFIAKPFDQKVESIYAIPNFGSSMAPIYTALALWVGCLFMNSALKSRPLPFDGLELMTLHEKHYGKMLTFCSIAVLQGLIVSLGDILMLRIYTVNAALFILFSVFSSLVFCIITFTLYSCFGNSGKALAIIYLIFQIPGSGGTYPIQVNPLIFKILQPLCPFAYTVSGFREAIAGPTTSEVLLDFTVLGVFAIVFLIAGYFLLEKTEEPVRRFEEMFKNSGLSE